MIVHSPETLMSPPYSAYVAQRAGAISDILATVIAADVDVQLCPRAIGPAEVIVGRDSIVYGCVVDSPEHGLKSALYRDRGSDGGMAYSVTEVAGRAQHFFSQGDRVRLKDPRESDGKGQHTVHDAAEVEAVVDEYPGIGEHGLVVMPHLQVDQDGRYTVGRVNLGRYGDYSYVGREFTINHPDGSEVRGGGDLALVRAADRAALQTAAQLLGVPESVIKAGEQALQRYAEIVLHLGCASVDVLVGKTDSGQKHTAVVDITPRVNGFSGEEVLAMRELIRDPDAHVVLAYDRLYYNPDQDTPRRLSDVVLINDPSLLMVAGIGKVIGETHED